MTQRTKVITTFEAQHVIQPIYTGGDVALDREGLLLATCLGEEALLTDLTTGSLLARIEGVSEAGLLGLPTLKEENRMARFSPHSPV